MFIKKITTYHEASWYLENCPEEEKEEALAKTLELANKFSDLFYVHIWSAANATNSVEKVIARGLVLVTDIYDCNNRLFGKLSDDSKLKADCFKKMISLAKDMDDLEFLREGKREYLANNPEVSMLLQNEIRKNIIIRELSEMPKWILKFFSNDWILPGEILEHDPIFYIYGYAEKRVLILTNLRIIHFGIDTVFLTLFYKNICQVQNSFEVTYVPFRKKKTVNVFMNGSSSNTCIYSEFKKRGYYVCDEIVKKINNKILDSRKS